MSDNSIVVIGAGASGLIAAGRAAQSGARVTLLEKTDSGGKKLDLTGNRRCNLTNLKDLDEFIAMYGPNGRFLHGAFRRFFRDDLLGLLKRLGVETQAEPDGRVFPASGDARDVVRALVRYGLTNGVRTVLNCRVSAIRVSGGRAEGVQTSSGFYPARAVILAAGGASYPQTGSSGDGYALAESLGHAIVRLRPALVPITVRESALAKQLQGASLPDVRLTAFQSPASKLDPALIPARDCGRGTGRAPRLPIVESRRGEIMFTHFGLSGPATLLMSLAIVDALDNGPVSLAMDLLPDMDTKQLQLRLQQEFDSHGKSSFRNLVTRLLPPRISDVIVGASGIPAEKPGHQITSEEKAGLLGLLKSLRFNVSGPLPMAAAMVTAGGVSLDEIDPRTLESRLIKGLYFCGEVMDIDGDTGGYNLQAAFSTGWVAGEQAASLPA